METLLIDRLPRVRGSLHRDANLGKRSFFGVGGKAEVLFIPEDIDDLVSFLKNVPDNVHITVLGAISNVLVRGGGISGVVIILGDWFKKIYVENNILEVGAGVNCSKLSNTTTDSELGGLEFLVGIPGTIGGALKMNAGCYGSEISDVLVEFEAVSTTGKIKWFTKNDLNFSYRTSNISDNLIVTRVWFRGHSHVNYSIIKKINSIVEKRKESQPIGKKSCGSTFKNPENGKKAWELINESGCNGMRVGGAAVSEKHCNFIINENNATPEDIEELGEKVIKKVYENSGIILEWEIVRVGSKTNITKTDSK